MCVNVCVVKPEARDSDLHGNYMGVCEEKTGNVKWIQSFHLVARHKSFLPAGFFILSHKTRSELRSVPDVKHWAVQRWLIF